MNWNKDGDVSFEEFLDSTSNQLSKVFELFQWRWSTGNVMIVPDKTRIKKTLIRLITLAFEESDQRWSGGTGRIEIRLDKAAGELQVLLDVSSFFGEPCEVDEDVDLLFPGFNDAPEVGSD